MNKDKPVKIIKIFTEYGTLIYGDPRLERQQSKDREEYFRRCLRESNQRKKKDE